MSKTLLYTIASITLLLCAGVIAVSFDSSLLGSIQNNLDVSDTLFGGLFLALGAATLSLPA